jgi:plastocyanin
MRLLAVVIAAGLLTWAVAPAAGQQRKARTHTVTIEATAFAPAAVTVAPGDTILWVNKDPFPHTATSASGKFDSGTIEAGKSWKHVVRAKGKFDYTCTFHPTMKGVVRVE